MWLSSLSFTQHAHAHTHTQVQLDATNIKLNEVEAGHKAACARERELQDEYSRTLTMLDKHRTQVCVV